MSLSSTAPSFQAHGERHITLNISATDHDSGQWHPGRGDRRLATHHWSRIQESVADPGPIWIDTQHRLLAYGLTLIFKEADIPTQSEPQGASICLRDYSNHQGRPPMRPDLPTLALVKQGTVESELFELIHLEYRGYIFADCDVQTLLQSVAAVYRGELWIDPHVMMRYLAPHHSGQLLTSREREVLFYLRRGWTNLQIAKQLAITPKTVKTHVSAVLYKYGVRKRTELMAGSS